MWCDLSSTSGRTLPKTETSALGTRAPAPMPVRFTLESFPQSAHAKNEAGLPWGAVVTPWTPAVWRSERRTENPNSSSIQRHLLATRNLSAETVPRCAVCGSWLNSTCMMQRDNWHCIMCNHWNQVNGHRPAIDAAGRGESRYPEMNRSWCEFHAGDSAKHQVIAHVLILDLSVACVDVQSKDERRMYLHAVRDGLVRAVTNMSRGAWVSLLCVDNTPRTTVCDVQGMRRTSSSSSTTIWTPPRLLRSFVVNANVDGADASRLSTPLVDMLQGSKLAHNVEKRRGALVHAITVLVDRALANLDRSIPSSDSIEQIQTTMCNTMATIRGVLEYLSCPPPSSSSCRGDPTYTQSVVAARIAVVTPGWSTDDSVNVIAMHAAELERTRKTMSTCGICLDMYHSGTTDKKMNALSEQLTSLSITTGGRARFYNAQIEQYQRALRDDLSTNVGASYAACGIVEIRTSEGFRVLLPSETYSNSSKNSGSSSGSGGSGSSGGNNESGSSGVVLNSSALSVGWRAMEQDTLGIDERIYIAGSDQSTCFPISFTTDVSSMGGSSVSENVCNPIVQVSFVYCTQGKQDDGTVQRWTRVITMRCGSTSNTPRSIMLHADTECLFYVMTHQVIAMFLQEVQQHQNENEKDEPSGTSELVFDWLVFLMASYHRNIVQSVDDHSVHYVLSNNDKSLSHLSSLTQLVFGLRRRLQLFRKSSNSNSSSSNSSSSSSSSNISSHHSSTAMLLPHLLGLTPSELARTVYPVVKMFNGGLRVTSTDAKVESGEPYIALSWSMLSKTMSRRPKHIVMVDTGDTVHLLRNGHGCTPSSLRARDDQKEDYEVEVEVEVEVEDGDREDPEEEHATTIDHLLHRRRATSTRSPIISTYDVRSQDYINAFRHNICVDDGAGNERHTYRYFCEQLKQEAQRYLKANKN